VTSDLVRRIWEHKQGLIGGFTNEYGVKTLVYFEAHPAMLDAIAREKRIKKWRRAWKIALISRDNPTWQDLYWEVAGVASAPGSPLSRG
jgi:putative endonuclease